MEDQAALERVERVEALLEDLESLDGPAREKALEVTRALLELYGEGLERLVEHIAEHDEEGGIASDVASDELVSHLLLVHGLHPVALEARVRGVGLTGAKYVSVGSDTDTPRRRARQRSQATWIAPRLTQAFILARTARHTLCCRFLIQPKDTCETTTSSRRGNCAGRGGSFGNHLRCACSGGG